MRWPAASTSIKSRAEVTMNHDAIEGGCQCGLVRYRATGTPVVTTICHCSMCRRASAAPAVAWVMYKESQVAFLKQAPQAYLSSPGVKRSFCPRCGTQICFTAEYIPGLIDITVGSLDHPERVQPQLHYWESRRLPWMRFADALPRFPEFPPLE